MSSRETTPSISSPPETTDTSLTESSLPDTPMTELPSPDGSSTMEETETEETTVEPDDASSFKDTTPKAKTGGKRKASSTTEGPKEKKSRAKPASKPKKESGETSRATWEPAHNSYILQAKAERKTNKETAEGLQSTFGIEKAPGAVTKQLSRLKAKNFDWTEELETMLRESVKEFFNGKTNTYHVVCGLFKGKSKVDLMQEAVVAKLKAWENDGEIEKLG